MRRRKLYWMPRVWIAMSVSTASNEWFGTRRAARLWADAEERETGERFLVRSYTVTPRKK